MQELLGSIVGMAYHRDLRIDRASLQPDILVVGLDHVLFDEALVFQRKETAGQLKLEGPKQQDEELGRQAGLNQLKVTFASFPISLTSWSRTSISSVSLSRWEGRNDSFWFVYCHSQFVFLTHSFFPKARSMMTPLDETFNRETPARSLPGQGSDWLKVSLVVARSRWILPPDRWQ